MNKFIAFDQALNTTGFCLFENGNLKSINKFTTNSTFTVEEKLYELRKFIMELLDQEKPDTILIEGIQLQKIPGSQDNANVETFKKLAFAQSMFLEISAELQVKCITIPSSTWKSTCGIKGRARAEQKRNAQIFVEKNYHIKAIQDICDAICIAHHHLHNLEKEINWE